MPYAATEIIQEMIREMIPFFIFQKVAEVDKNDAREPGKTYSDFIRALAGRFTAGTIEAKDLTQEIFIDIWQFAERSAEPPSTEEILSALIARQRLLNYLR